MENDDPITESLNPRERRRMLILGAIEFIPVMIGAIAAGVVDSTAWRIIAVVLGLLVCIFVCWLLRNKTPSTRIYHR